MLKYNLKIDINMRYVQSVFSLLIFVLLSVSGCITGNVVKNLDGPFVVTKAVDGDTLDLNDGSRLRFSGINTPETGECYYQEAKEKLKALTFGKEVFLEKDRTDIDKYGRKLRYVYTNESSNLVLVNAVMVEEGYARVYDKYKSDTKRYDELKKFESKAKENNLGVWNCVDNKKDCMYVGSENSDKYHTPDCKFAKKIKAENLVCFNSLEDAGNGGREFSGC